MSYDLDLLSKGRNVNEAEAQFHKFMESRKGWEVEGEQGSWTYGTSESGILVDLISDEQREEFDPSEGDDPRTVAWLSFNFFRDPNYYVAIADELDALLATGLFRLYDPQLEKKWSRRINRRQMFGMVADTNALFDQ